MKKLSDDILKRLDGIVTLLERQTALMISQQLLTECVAPDGTPREAEDCANIVIESYSAALCLARDLDDRNRNFEYQCAEFFVEESDDDDEDDDDGYDFKNSGLATLS